VVVRERDAASIDEDRPAEGVAEDFVGNGLDFESIHEAYRPRIRRYLVRLVGETEADDLTQEVFVKAHRNLATFRGQSRVATWLYRIATHAAIDRMRTPAFRKETVSASLEEAGGSPGWEAWPAADQLSLEQALFRKERFHCFLRFLNDLPSAYRIVFVLGELESLTNREIAEILGLSLDTVKIRLHRARTRLFQELRAHCNPEEWL
jgi:RNA polymerase sigma-70 factor (ECF subfamily)